MASTGLAGTLTVWPVRVSLPAQGKAQVVSLTNEGDVSTLVQVEVLGWEDDPNVEELLPTRDVLVVPPVVEVAAGSSQIIRLALRKPLELEQEASYRLVITEVPREVGTDQGISFAVRLNLPVFVTPDGALPQPSWSLASTGGDTTLTLDNQGNAHVRVTRLSLFAEGGAEPLFVSDQGGYVLAGGERSWSVELDRIKAGTSLIVKTETNLGELEAPVDIQG
ncbi:MAG: fimbria/pilus periplasmic chaperone [Pseudomonadota bacterium]